MDIKGCCSIDDVKKAWEAATQSAYGPDLSGHNLSGEEIEALATLIQRIDLSEADAHSFLTRIAGKAYEVFRRNGDVRLWDPAQKLEVLANSLAAQALKNEGLGAAFLIAGLTVHKDEEFQKEEEFRFTDDELTVLLEMVEVAAPKFKNHQLFSNIANKAAELNGFSTEGSSRDALTKSLRDAASAKAAEALKAVCPAPTGSLQLKTPAL